MSIEIYVVDKDGKSRASLRKSRNINKCITLAGKQFDTESEAVTFWREVTENGINNPNFLVIIDMDKAKEKGHPIYGVIHSTDNASVSPYFWILTHVFFSTISL